MCAPIVSSSSTGQFIRLASDKNLWYSVVAFVALVKPLDLFKGAASSIQLAVLFCFLLRAPEKHQIAQLN